MDFFDNSFLEDSTSNALSTFFEAALSLPVAVWINRHQEKSSEQERKKQKQVLMVDSYEMSLGELFQAKGSLNG